MVRRTNSVGVTSSLIAKECLTHTSAAVKSSSRFIARTALSFAHTSGPRLGTLADER